MHLTEDKDTVRWNVKKYGKLRTSYSYKQIEFSGVRDLNRYAWYVVLSYPSKDQKLLVAFSSSQNTSRRPANRKWTEGERMVHIMWCCCKCRPYNVHLPNSMIRLVHRRAPMAELSNASLWFHYQILWPGWKKKKTLMILMGCVFWIHQLTRNELVCQNKVISSPNTCVHRVLLFMQWWRASQKHEDQCKIDH